MNEDDVWQRNPYFRASRQIATQLCPVDLEAQRQVETIVLNLLREDLWLATLKQLSFKSAQSIAAVLAEPPSAHEIALLVEERLRSELRPFLEQNDRDGWWVFAQDVLFQDVFFRQVIEKFE